MRVLLNDMFMDLMNFGLKRTVTQAVGFYLAYLILTVVTAGLGGGVVSLFAGKADNIEFGVTIGIGIAILMSVGLGYQVLNKKHLTGNIQLLLLAGLSGILAYVGGGLLGLIPVAYFTTLRKK